MSELEELRNEACTSSRIYKEKMKAYHDKHIRRKNFIQGQKQYHNIETTQKNSGYILPLELCFHT
ncbi:unnamed protein product [Spirodela intermedia]|uniref:Uncharacterized protein n=1 Tax=Spirodela intermedia TaxID=51605 RepID=A0A7I8JAJ6_SPIIN|nr:unnamed protein product [Spirodela intermedia]CAA6666765.1 unnamed protein product [Spirodela intermedia]